MQNIEFLYPLSFKFISKDLVVVVVVVAATTATCTRCYLRWCMSKTLTQINNMTNRFTPSPPPPPPAPINNIMRPVRSAEKRYKLRWLAADGTGHRNSTKNHWSGLGFIQQQRLYVDWLWIACEMNVVFMPFTKQGLLVYTQTGCPPTSTALANRIRNRHTPFTLVLQLASLHDSPQASPLRRKMSVVDSLS